MDLSTSSTCRVALCCKRGTPLPVFSERATGSDDTTNVLESLPFSQSKVNDIISLGISGRFENFLLSVLHNSVTNVVRGEVPRSDTKIGRQRRHVGLRSRLMLSLLSILFCLVLIK